MTKVLSIITGWKQTYYNFLAWWWLVKSPYNNYDTWEFFAYLNPEVHDPYVFYLSERDYNTLLEAINSPPKYNESLAKLLARSAPWD